MKKPIKTALKELTSYGIFLLVLLTFFAAPCPAADDGSFGLIGDTRGKTETLYAAFIQHLEKSGIQTVVHLGDVIDKPDAAEQWEKFLKVTGNGVTLHIAPGNHDIDNVDSLARYEKMCGKENYYSTSRNDTLFLFLNSELPGQTAKITGQQFEWLEKQLSRNFKYKFVFLHRPVYPSTFGRGRGLDRYPTDRDRLHQLFVKYGVEVVIAGHEHLYNRSEKDGVDYVITGGGGAPLYNSTEDNGCFLHYILAKKTNEGYFFSVVDFKGNNRDEFSVKR
jgi:predicted phosphodiesterase